MTIALHWFRADLRIEDNTALHAAMQKSEKIKTVFIKTLKTWQSHDCSERKIQLMMQTLQTLSTRLAELSVPLIISEQSFFSDSVMTLIQLCDEHKIHDVYFNKQYELDEARRDEAVVNALSTLGIRCHVFDDQVIVAPGKILNLSGEPYKVFTPFKRAWLKHVNANLKLYRLKNADHSPALTKLNLFCENHLKHYHLQRDYPALNGTSMLSADLAIGTLSARQCLNKVIQHTHGELFDNEKHPGELTWLSELIWRDFYKHIIFFHPELCRHQPFKKSTNLLPWKKDENLLLAWQQGRTGFPIVDAAMRQLNQTGWMHNRLRMVTAMFFTKTLFLDWRLGEKYFMKNLIDGDFSANNGGWQWCASTGTDAVPYFRIFNPTTQSERFDKDGDFIRKYCPELASLSNKHIHDPYNAGVDLRSIHYPAPIVDYKKMRAYVIDQFKQYSQEI